MIFKVGPAQLHPGPEKILKPELAVSIFGWPLFGLKRSKPQYRVDSERWNDSLLPLDGMARSVQSISKQATLKSNTRRGRYELRQYAVRNTVWRNVGSDGALALAEEIRQPRGLSPSRLPPTLVPRWWICRRIHRRQKFQGVH
jgi:hypothetical protein